MKSSLFLTAPIVVALVALGSSAAERRDELHMDASSLSAWRTRFGTYGYQPRRAIFLEAAGLRFWLPSGVAGIPQTGLYSYFALAGDCEVTLAYEWLNVSPPRQGYGSGVGLAFDVEGEGGRGAIQRVLRTAEGSGYVLQTTPGEPAGNMKSVDRFVPAASKQGRIGLRRVKNELIFLRADSPTESLEEVDRLPFTDRTIRTVRLFADPGGSPTAVDVRLRQIEIRAEEIASGVPQLEPKSASWGWLWAVVSVAGGALGFRVWRVHRRQEPQKRPARSKIAAKRGRF